VLHAAGFTGRVLLPSEQFALLELGLGITNLVPGASRAAADLTPTELREGALVLESKVAQLRPAYVAVLGMQAYRTAFGRPSAVVGPQANLLAGAVVWLLPNPSGLQARYGLAEMTELFDQLRVAAGVPRRQDPAGPAKAQSVGDCSP
jgi:TDG/mug DNA glycosylase family protein